jgi:hypothetical protein
MPKEIKYPHLDEVPSTVSEAVAYLAETLPAETTAKIKSMTDEDLIFAHFDLGANIRNHLALWDPDSRIMRDARENYDIDHVDDVSIEIIRLIRSLLRCE